MVGGDRDGLLVSPDISGQFSRRSGRVPRVAAIASDTITLMAGQRTSAQRIGWIVYRDFSSS